MPLRLSRTRFRSVMSRWRANARTRAHHAVLVVKPAAFSGRTGSPADFAAWAERGISRTGGVPDAWRGRDDIPIRAPARVAVVLHVHYPELADEILDGLRSIPVPFDLIVTRSTKVPITIDRERVPGASSIVVLEVDNRGRDILPLISVVNAGLLDPYHLVLKVHTKRSVWREDHTELPGTGEAWRDRLLGDLLGDAANVRTHPGCLRDETGAGIGDGRWEPPPCRVLGRQPGGHRQPPASPGAGPAARRSRVRRRIDVLDPRLRPPGTAGPQPDGPRLRGGGRPGQRDDGPCGRTDRRDRHT